MCQICDDLHETIKIKHPYEYFQIVDQIKVMIDEGILMLIEGNCNFYDINRSKPFLGDIQYHVFKCVSCDNRFSLFVDTYHGSGGTWKSISD